MKTFAKLLALGAALAAAPVAFATPIKSQFVVHGSDNDALANFIGGSVTFAASPGQKTVGAGTGLLSFVPDGTVLNFATGFYLNSIPVTGEELFDFTMGGETYTFNVLSYSVVVSNGVINLYGMLQETGLSNVMSPAFFTMANNNGQLGPYQMEGFTGTFSILPEPSSLLLMGTGLIMGAALMLRRRRTA